CCFFFQAEDGIRDFHVTGVQTCALPIWMATLVFGLAATALASVGGLLGNLLEASTSIINFFGGALVGVFLLGMLSKRAESLGAAVGFLVGFLAVLLTAIATEISFMWYSAIGGMTTLFVGELVSRFSGRRPDEAQRQLVFSRRRVTEQSVSR